jgi:glucose/mannose transport system substrate-binding protein
VAHGGQDWQDFTTFESVVLGVGGTALYQNALVKMERDALASDEMRRALQVFRRIKGYVDDASKGRDWNVATEMVIKDRAAFQLMGDWAKGEFLAAGKTPGKEFQCVPVPGTEGAYTYNVDSFAMFQLRNWENQKAQGYLAYLLMGREFQEAFNLRKGSIPVRSGVPMDKFDDCGKRSAQDFAATAKSQTLLPSVAHGMAIASSAQGAMRAAVSEFWNNEKMSVGDLIAKLQSIPRSSSK